MGAYRITYEGPSLVAMQAATQLADADGVDLTSSQPPQRGQGAAGTMVLAMVVEGTEEAVKAAVVSVRAELPPGATIGMEDAAAPS